MLGEYRRINEEKQCNSRHIQNEIFSRRTRFTGEPLLVMDRGWCKFNKVEEMGYSPPLIRLKIAGLPRVREKSGKNKIFSRSGNCQGNFEKMSGNFGHLTNVREMSGNFVMTIKFFQK